MPPILICNIILTYKLLIVKYIIKNIFMFIIYNINIILYIFIYIIYYN